MGIREKHTDESGMEHVTWQTPAAPSPDVEQRLKRVLDAGILQWCIGDVWQLLADCQTALRQQPVQVAPGAVGVVSALGNGERFLSFTGSEFPPVGTKLYAAPHATPAEAAPGAVALWVDPVELLAVQQYGGMLVGTMQMERESRRVQPLYAPPHATPVVDALRLGLAIAEAGGSFSTLGREKGDEFIRLARAALEAAGRT